jgi:pimeloyl-ACP methyl ester carboxylesterase/putative sterol carrier protein
MPEFPELAWWQAYQQELNKDERWSEAARWFPARIEFRFGDGAATLDTRDGRAASVMEGPHPLGPDVVVSGPRHEWQRLLQGETNWFQGTSPGLGELTVEGNAVGALRNVKAMWLLLEAMKRTARELPPRPEPSPAPSPSGKPTIGRYVDVDGLRTYYEEAGEGPATIVCFHAACQDTLMWRHVLDGLSDECRVISIDAPAHAKTLEPEGGEFKSLTRHAEFNERLMEILGIEKPVIIGCSMGGNLVLELAARRPDAYAAVISCEGADYTPTVSQFLLDMLLVNGPQILECWSQSLIGDRTPPDRARDVVWQIRRNTPEVMAGDLTGYAGFDKRDQVGNITVPVLLLRGDADWLVSQEQVDATAARIPGSRVVVLAGTGHYPMTENPYEFNQAVRRFLHDVGLGVRGGAAREAVVR